MIPRISRDFRVFQLFIKTFTIDHILQQGKDMMSTYTRAQTLFSLWTRFSYYLRMSEGNRSTDVRTKFWTNQHFLTQPQQAASCKQTINLGVFIAAGKPAGLVLSSLLALLCASRNLFQGIFSLINLQVFP